MTVKQKLKRILRSLVLLSKEKERVPILTPTNTEHLLDGKVALITGGSSGIGYAIAERFVRSGCSVIISGRNEEKLKRCCAQICNIKDGCAKYIVLDVLNVPPMYDKIKEAADFFESKRIDILVNSAGLVARSGFSSITEEEYDAIMNTNAKGTYFMSQAMSKFMIERNIKGHILNLSSSSALRPAWTPYQMSKWAVRGLTLGLADTLLPHGIIVNAIAPGPTATPMLKKENSENLYLWNSPSGRFAHPAEIANLAVFMVSDMGNLIVGDTFYITGGSGTITYHG